MSIIKKSAPWVEYYRKVNALFEKDPQVNVVYDEEANKLSLYISNSEKADALSQLLPTEMNYGNVTLEIAVVPGNLLRSCKGDLIITAFKDNPIVDKIEVVDNVFTNRIYYVIFNKVVVQYFDDSLDDAYGLRSTLYEDIAREVFENHEGVFFCTNNVDQYTWTITSATTACSR